MSFTVVVAINILFLVYFQFDEETMTTMWSQNNMEEIIAILGIGQTGISLLVIILYYLQYQGKIRQLYLEGNQVRFKDIITYTKGSMGYSMGLQIHKQYTTEQLMDMALQRNEEGRRFRAKCNRCADFFKYFFLGYTIDTQHIFNTGYFSVSLLAVFYHEIYSILLLDLILKIPLLQSVINVIIQNKMQLMYTGLLMLIIIYIYSFFGLSFLQGNPNDRLSLSSFDEEGDIFC